MAYIFYYFICLSTLIFNLATCQIDEEEAEERAKRFADLMKHDGVDRVLTLTSSNYDKLVGKERLVVLFHAHTKNEDLKKEKYLLEVVAKVFDGQKIAFAVCSVINHEKIAKKAGVKYVSVIKVFNHGKISDYTGQRSADVMVPYLSRLFMSPVTEITSKVQKKKFETTDLVKVIAYVNHNSKEFTQLEIAARAFQPMVPFYAVFDSKFAKFFQLKKLNSIRLIKPYEKPVVYGKNLPFEEENIIKFVKENKRQLIQKLRLENLHDIWAADRKGFLIPVFARTNVEDGARFYSIVKKVARDLAKNELLHFVWIDPEPFPSMRDHWRETFNIDPMEPSIGAVDVSKQVSSWLQIPAQITKADAITKDVKKWLRKLLAGDIELKPMKRARDAENNASGNTEQNTNKDEL